MSTYGTPGKYGLENHGLFNLRDVYWNLQPSALVEQIVQRGEGILAQNGAVVVRTGAFTGRAPNDKFIVQNELEEEQAIWANQNNQPIKADKFEHLWSKIRAYFQGRDIFVQDLSAGAHPNYRMPIRLITTKAWSALFANDLFIRPALVELLDHEPGFTVVQVPDFFAIPEEDGTRTGTFIILDFHKRIILIGGTSYAGEIKKAVFTVMNFLLPQLGILPMHCSANIGENQDVALFFGLSGTGKTTLSSDASRRLIGDDEHGWSDEGVFNFEGGCYAKTIRLRQNLEPQIWDAAHHFGVVLENIVCDPDTRELNFDSDRYTENTRASYPIDYVANHVVDGYAGHPQNIFFLSADAFGVLPPIAKLTPEQAIYYFLSGYTSKLAGTENGLSTEPTATFSTCFGAPFLPLPPKVYADLLLQKIIRYQTQVWLVNTGWTGGSYNIGERIPLPHTRNMIKAVLEKRLDNSSTRNDRFFGLAVPKICPGIPTEILDPELTWRDWRDYEIKAREQAIRFEVNFKQFEKEVPEAVASAGPHRD